MSDDQIVFAWEAAFGEGFDLAMKSNAEALAIQRERIEALESMLREVVDMETNRYACASERNLVFARARAMLEGK